MPHRPPPRHGLYTQITAGPARLARPPTPSNRRVAKGIMTGVINMTCGGADIEQNKRVYSKHTRRHGRGWPLGDLARRHLVLAPVPRAGVTALAQRQRRASYARGAARDMQGHAHAPAATGAEGAWGGAGRVEGGRHSTLRVLATLAAHARMPHTQARLPHATRTHARTQATRRVARTRARTRARSLAARAPAMTKPSRVLSKAREAVSGASLYLVESAPARG